LELLMLTSQRLLVRFAARALVVISSMLLAVIAMLLGWIITAHASGDASEARGGARIAAACERLAAPDCIVLVTKPATLANFGKPGVRGGFKRKGQ
jgi:hypothetical protein